VACERREVCDVCEMCEMCEVCGVCDICDVYVMRDVRGCATCMPCGSVWGCVPLQHTNNTPQRTPAYRSTSQRTTTSHHIITRHNTS
jgi:hypothetical protein